MSNPYQAGADISPTATVAHSEKTLAIAKYQRAVLLCVLAMVLIYFMAVFASALLEAPWVVQLLLPLAYWVVALVAVVYTILLARLVYGPISGVIVGLLVLVPCLNLLVLLGVTSRATQALKAEGIHVGFLGANLSKL